MALPGGGVVAASYRGVSVWYAEVTVWATAGSVGMSGRIGRGGGSVCFEARESGDSMCLTRGIDLTGFVESWY